jgi:hypothetical protein
MSRESESEVLEFENARLREEQRQILGALQMLFNLLEEYAPTWYTQEHQNTALSALKASDPCLKLETTPARV